MEDQEEEVMITADPDEEEVQKFIQFIKETYGK